MGGRAPGAPGAPGWGLRFVGPRALLGPLGPLLFWGPEGPGPIWGPRAYALGTPVPISKLRI